MEEEGGVKEGNRMPFTSFQTVRAYIGYFGILDTGVKMIWDTGFEPRKLDTHVLNLGYWDTEFGILDTGIMKLGY